MKTLAFLFGIVFLFVGCSNDISKLSKKECLKEGHKFKAQKKLNFRTGKYELKTICLKRS